jgi:branched-chain amino acid transport system substrate-binding protein
MSRSEKVTRRGVLRGAAGLAAAGTMGFPGILRAQDVLKFGHLTPLTGFLGPLGEFAQMGVKLALEEVNGAGGVMGRKIELVMEDSVNPQTASQKAERFVERDKVACIIGEISSASGLAIAQVVDRASVLYINTGCNSDALRGSDCKKFMFHVEAQNSMYVKAVGRGLLADNMVKGKRWYSLTADYAFGHDLLKVAKMFMEKNGGQFAADELIPTDISDFSPFLLKIRQARPDIVISNLAGNQITNFLKQYSEYGLQFPVVGFAFDTAVAWGLGKGNFAGVWPLVWHHLVDTPTSKKYIETFSKKYGKPPENQSWGDYFSLRIVSQSMAEMKSTDPIKLAEHLRKGAKFDIGKTREGYFRAYDNQMMMEMYAVRAKKAADMKDQWDIYDALGTVPGSGDDLESIAPPKGACNMA